MATEQIRVEPRHEKTVVALLQSVDEVVAAVRRLHSLGFHNDQISLLAKDEAAVRDAVREVGAVDGTEMSLPDDLADAVEPKGRDEAAGMAIGGAVGFLLGLTAVAIPGFGTFLLAAGPVAIAINALTVSAAGLGLGALVGAILDERVTEEHRDFYKDRLEAGDWMLVLHGDEKSAERAAEMLRAENARHVETI